MEFDAVFNSELYMSGESEDKLISELEADLEYEILGDMYSSEVEGLQLSYWDNEIRNYERVELIEALVQNDISTSYIVDPNKGSVQSTKMDYFASNFKKVNDSKSEGKVPNFRENEIRLNHIRVPEYQLLEKLAELGGEYLRRKRP